jgi:hypothetical protein
MELFGLLCFIITMVAVGTNGLMMLISPRKWYRMPFWIRLSGILSRDKYQSGWGAIQIRLLGAILFFVVVYFIYSAFSGT